MKAETSKTLAEIGVQPGWFCRHSGCSIWFEIITVFDNAVVCVSRDPKKRTEYARHGEGWSAIWELSEEQPEGSVIFKDRKKNFYDKFHPEPENIINRTAGLRPA